MWRHPEWWSVALSIAAWIALVSTPRHSSSHRSTAINLMFWLLMVVAMMFPLVMAQVRQAAFHSLWSRRHRAIGVFLDRLRDALARVWRACHFHSGRPAHRQAGVRDCRDPRRRGLAGFAFETPRPQQLPPDHAARAARMARELGLPEVWVAHRHGVRVRVLGVDAGMCRQRPRHPDHVRRNNGGDLRSRRAMRQTCRPGVEPKRSLGCVGVFRLRPDRRRDGRCHPLLSRRIRRRVPPRILRIAGVKATPPCRRHESQYRAG